MLEFTSLQRELGAPPFHDFVDIVYESRLRTATQRQLLHSIYEQTFYCKFPTRPLHNTWIDDEGVTIGRARFSPLQSEVATEILPRAHLPIIEQLFVAMQANCPIILVSGGLSYSIAL